MAVHVDVAPMIKHIYAAVDIDFKGSSDILGLRLALLAKQFIQVPQDWHILRAGVLQVIPVHQAGAAVNDGFLDRGTAAA